MSVSQGAGVEGERWTRNLGLVQTITFRMNKQGTEKYISSPGINHNGKNIKKNIYVCSSVTLLCSRDWHNIVNKLHFNENQS